MNIEHATSISLVKILDKLNLKPIQQENGIAMYVSPLHGEQKSILKIVLSDNTWHDEVSDRGGDNIAFVCAYLESQAVSCTPADAFRWLKNMIEDAARIAPIKTQKIIYEHLKLSLKKKMIIRHLRLIRYLAVHGIPLNVANRDLMQLKLYSKTSKKHSYALGMRNENEGYDVFTPFFAGFIKRQDITFIRGTIPKPDHIHIFKNVFDYMSAVIQHNQERPFKDDAIILTSLSNLTKATPFIKNYGYKAVYTWMDNNDLGKEATKSIQDFCKTEDHLDHKPQNSLYARYASVNAWHMDRLRLPNQITDEQSLTTV